jgi:selenocysteine-specific elongation factor
LVLRDGSARLTLAGAKVLDIAPPVRARKSPERLDALRIFCLASPAGVADSLLRSSVVPISIEHLARAMNRTPEQLAQQLTEPVALTLKVSQTELLFGARAHKTMTEQVFGSLQAFHASEPDEPGVALERLRRMAVPFIDISVFKEWTQYQIQIGDLALTGSFVHLPGHRVTLSAAEQTLWQKILPKMLDRSFDPPWLRDLARDVAAKEDSLRLLLKKQARTSLVVQVVKDLFYPQTTMVALANLFRELNAQHGAVSVIQFRDHSGLGRKRAIQVLEAFDRIGLTRRLVKKTGSNRGTDMDHRILRNAGLFVDGDKG